ncbi:hypothetical protein SFUMM280S_02468 [Streptomyces fumanus]
MGGGERLDRRPAAQPQGPPGHVRQRHPAGRPGCHRRRPRRGPRLAGDVLRRPRGDHPARRRSRCPARGADRRAALQGQARAGPRPGPAGRRSEAALRAGRTRRRRFNVSDARRILAERPRAGAPGRSEISAGPPPAGRAPPTRSRRSTSRPFAANLPTATGPDGHTWWSGSRPRPGRATAVLDGGAAGAIGGAAQGASAACVTGDGLEVPRGRPGPPRSWPASRCDRLRRLDLRRLPWKTVGKQRREVPRLPRLVGETSRRGLRGRPPVGRPRGAQDGADPRCLRVPGPEVLGDRAARTSPAPIWSDGFKEELAAEVDGIAMGDVDRPGRLLRRRRPIDRARRRRRTRPPPTAYRGPILGGAPSWPAAPTYDAVLAQLAWAPDRHRAAPARSSTDGRAAAAEHDRPELRYAACVYDVEKYDRDA